MRIREIIFLNFLLVFTLFYCVSASACYYYKDYNPKAATILNVDMGSVTMASDAVGGVIATKEGAMTSFGGAPAGFSCGTDGASGSVTATIGLTGDGTSTAGATYDTNIPGIGVRIYYYTLQSYGSEPLTPTQLATSIPVVIQKQYYTQYRNQNAAIKIELVKTGSVNQVQSGQLKFTRHGMMGVDNGAGDGSPAVDLVDLNVTATVTSNTCDVSAATPSKVNMDPVSSGDLKHKGATSGDTPFEVVLNCSGNTNVNLLLDGQEDSNAPGEGVLAIQEGVKAAKGVGVQLLYNDRPTEFEKAFSVGNSMNGRFTIPLVARYYRTTEMPIKSGDVSAQVVYNLTYK
ncbi:TPA: fimbrial protein [Citrobacter amalonaticus]